MRLELDSIRARTGNRINIGVRHTQTTVMGLGNFTDDKATALTDSVSIDIEMRATHHFPRFIRKLCKRSSNFAPKRVKKPREVVGESMLTSFNLEPIKIR